MTLTAEQKQAWDRDGFFIIRGFAETAVTDGMSDEIVSLIRQDPPAKHAEASFYLIDKMLVTIEGQEDMPAVNPEDRVSKVFNCHLSGKAMNFALSDAVADTVSDLIGEDIDVFQSQFIFKNPGAWGQPWHQDSYYFTFDKQPQIGVWLALSEATLENGCLAVVPGSHKDPVHPHGPDKRPGANHGYLEIDEDQFAAEKAEPVLMEPGDLLVFHSYLVHRSFDNKATGSRQAMVYHYGKAGTKPIAHAEKLSVVNHWLPVRRKAG